MSDYAVIPVVADSQFSIDGLNRMLDFINEQKKTSNTNLKFLKAVINMVDMRMGLIKPIKSAILDKLGDSGVFASEIPANSAIKQAEYVMRSVIDYKPSSRSANSFFKLAEELERTIQGENNV